MPAPWHLYGVGIVSLLWNGFGAADYVMTKYGVEAYVANMPPEMRDHLAAYPAWMTLVWALAVWVPVVAALFLLARRKAAAGLFGLGLILVLVAGLWNYVLSDPPLTAVAGGLEEEGNMAEGEYACVHDFDAGGP